MNLELDVSDVGVALDFLAKKAGETTEQATMRLGVSVGKTIAVAQDPKGKTIPRGPRRKRTEAQMRRVVMPVRSTRYFNRLVSGQYKRVPMGHVWIDVKRDQLVKNDHELYSVIEKNRDSRGRTRKLPRERRYICSLRDFNRVAIRRAKNWGISKGSWLGAAVDLSRRQRGMNRNTLGKNYISAAQKHIKHGSGRKQGREHKTTALLMSKAQGARSLPRREIATAVSVGWKATERYYKGEIRRLRRTSRR